MKKCSCCGKEKPLSDFGIRKRKTKEGSYEVYNCYCKLCNSERSKQWYYNMKTKGLKFVYRLVNDENEVVYVGKTESLPTRTNQHFSKNSHLFPRLKKDEKLRLQYIAMTSSALMDIREIYYINLYKPKYNMTYMNDEPSIFISDFKTDVWLDYINSEDVKVQNYTNEKNEFANVRSIFKRKRGNRYCVYVEIKNFDGKNKQILKGSFVNEIEADSLLKKLKADTRLN